MASSGCNNYIFVFNLNFFNSFGERSKIVDDEKFQNLCFQFQNPIPIHRFGTIAIVKTLEFIGSECSNSEPQFRKLKLEEWQDPLVIEEDKNMQCLLGIEREEKIMNSSSELRKYSKN